MNDIPTGIVTFLFTDIEGSTKLAQEFHDKLPEVMGKHHSILQETIESNNGFVFKIIGDAFCCAFQNSFDAVKAAVEAQIKLNSENWEETELKVRMGIHSGNAEWSGSDYMGYITLARTSRVMSAAYGGQILISNDAYELCIPKQGLGNKNEIREISFRDLGERRLKDVIQPIRLYQILSKGLREDFPPLKTLDARPNNLPVQLASFIGREDEMKLIKDLLKQTHLLTLTGSGGAGKTRLSLQIGADVIDEFADGIWFIELAAISEPALLMQEIMKVFRLKEEANRNPEEIICEYLRDKELLILLDNCEHLVIPCANLCDKLLSSCPKLKIIATSREALRCEGEQIHRVKSLDTPDPKEKTSPEKLSQYEAVRLFIERALMIDKNFRVNNDNAPSLAEICYQLDGIPLAIELAAARIKILSVEKINERLNDRFKLLTGGTRTALPRQQTLRALIDWSYDLLSEKEKIFWARVSVFSGGWTLEATENICADIKLNTAEILDILNHLIEKSIIIFDNRNERYRILETLKQYGAEKLRAESEPEKILSKHLRYFMEFAEIGELKLKGSEEKIWLEKLEADHSNIQSAIEWSINGGNKEEGARLAGAMQVFWGVRGYFTTGRRLLENINNSTDKMSKGTIGKVKSRLGSQLLFLGEYEKSKNLLEEGLALLRETGNQQAIKDTINMLGNVVGYLGDYERSQKLFEENLSIGRNSGDKYLVAISLNNLGNKEFAQGNYPKAKALYEECLAIRRELGNKQGIAIALYNLGNITLDQGEYDQSKKLFKESLEISREVGDKRMIASSLNCLGGTAMMLNDYNNARLLIEEDLTLNREIGEKRNIARSLSFLGRLELSLCNDEEALKIFNETFALTSQIGETSGIAYSLNDLGNVFYLSENYEQAEKYYYESLKIRRELEEKPGIAQSLNDMGNVSYSKGDFKKARKYFLESLALKREMNESNNIPSTLIGIAGVIAETDPHHSVKLLGSIEENLKSTNWSVGRIDEKLMAKSVDKLHEKLNNEEYSKYFAEGRKMTLEKAADSILNVKW